MNHQVSSEFLRYLPQGTVLGPVMFLLYINVITKEINLPLHLFADDCCFIDWTIDNAHSYDWTNGLNALGSNKLAKPW